MVAQTTEARNKGTHQNLQECPAGTTHKFTGDERDSETNLDHTWFRNYSSQLGRWSTADPARLPDGQAGLLAVSLDAPQSLNRYSYVSNMPLSYFDSTGLGQCTATERMDGDCGHQPNDAVGPGQYCDPMDQSCNATCIVNGFASSCGMTISLLQQGLAGICPNDDCFNQTFTTNNSGVSGFIPTFASVYLASMSNSGGCIGTTCVLQVSFFQPASSPDLALSFPQGQGPWYFNPKGLGGRYPPNSGPTLQKPPINPTEPPPEIHVLDPARETFLGSLAEILRGFAEGSFHADIPFLLTPCDDGAIPQFSPNGLVCPRVY